MQAAAVRAKSLPPARKHEVLPPPMDDDRPTQRVRADSGDSTQPPKNEVVFNRYELLSELGR